MKPAPVPLAPGGSIGILGSGQLGRMLALAARPFGYAVHVYAPDASGSPAAQVADSATQAAYLDEAALREFARMCDVVTVEFENIPAEALELLGQWTAVRPGARSLRLSQNRLREKEFLVSAGLPVAPFRTVRSEDGLKEALGEIGWPAVLKTAGFGYDGKGQALLRSPRDLPRAEAILAGGEAVLEAFVDFSSEVSVVAARTSGGVTGSFGLFHNDHVNHILDVTAVLPEDGTDGAEQEAAGIARQIADALGHVGVLCVELFRLGDGRLLVNEIAPRVHNSGHLTIEAAGSSQFQQHIRAVAGLPPGDFSFRSPAAMANLLGDLWENGEPDWAAALADPRVQLHLYGKEEARPGRKMGHLTAVAGTASEAREAVLAARHRLLQRT